MTVIAAPGDTWGIPGPTFLLGYVVLIGVTLWLAILLRRGAVRGTRRTATDGLVAGGRLPPGFDGDRVDAARRALLRKRAGEVAEAWPLLAGSLGPDHTPLFAAWAAGRAPAGSFADGLAFARHLRDVGALPPLASEELTTREAPPRRARRWRRRR